MSNVLRFCLAVFLGCTSFSMYGYAQEDESEDISLDHFNGGSLSLELFMTNWHMSGAGQKASALAGLPCTFRPNVEDVLNNPAGIGYIGRAGLMLDYAAPMPLPLDRFIGIEDMVQDAETENFEDAFDVLPADFDSRKTRIGDVTAGQRGTFTGLAFALPLRYANLGFGITNPFDLKLRVLGSGIEVTAATEIASIPLTSALSVDMVMDLDMQTNMTTVGVAREFGAGFSGGITLDKHDVALDLVGELVPQGLVTTNSEFPINDGDFTQSVRGELRGSGIGTRIGLSYHAPRVFSLDLVYAAVPTLEMDGELATRQSSYPLFDGVGLNTDDVNPSNPLAGRTTDSTIYDGMTVRLPSSFAVAIGLHGGSVGFGLGYKKYLGELSFEMPDGNKQGLKYGSDFSLALDARYFRLGLGLVTFDVVGEVPDSGKSVVDVASMVDSLDLPFLAMPKFSIGFAFPVGQAVDVNTVLLAMPPLGVLKTTLTYNWDMQALEKRAKRIDPMVLYDNAMQLFETGKFLDAAFAFGSLAVSFPAFSKNSAARFYVGESFYMAGYEAAADEAYADMMQRYPDDPLLERALLRQGQMLYHRGEYGQVMEQYAQIKKDFPTSTYLDELAYLAGQGLLKQDKYKEAAEILAQVSTESASFKYAQYSLGQCAIYAEDGKGAVDAFRKVFAKPAALPAEKALDDRTRLALGHLLYEMVDYEGALKEYGAVTDTAGGIYEQALVGRAWSLVKQKKFDAVSGVVETLLKRFPEGAYAAEANLLLGYCRSLERKYPEAIVLYKKAIEICTKPTGIRKTQIDQLRAEKENAVKAAETAFGKAVAPAFRLALSPADEQRDARARSLQQDAALKEAAARKAADALDEFGAAVRVMNWKETLLHDAQAALPTAEHMKQETDKAKADAEYEKKLKALEEQMQQKLKQQAR